MPPPVVRSWSGLALWTCTLLVVTAAACGDPVGPRPVLPHIARMDLEILRDGPDNGVLFVNASPTDTSFRRGSRRVPIQLAVSSGDRETAWLANRVCPQPRNAFLCFLIDITLDSGKTAEDIAPYVAGIGARFAHFYGGRYLSVTIFAEDGVARAAHRAAAWPGVAIADLAGEFCEFPSVCAHRSQLRLPIPLDDSPPRQYDGYLQIRSADTVRATYTQPDGSNFEISTVVR